MSEERGEINNTQTLQANNVGESRNEELIDSDKNLRRWCLVKGYAGLLCHLLSITAIILIFMYCVPIANAPYFRGPTAFWLSLVMMLLSMILITVTFLRQASYPMSLVALLILTVCAGVFLGVAYGIYQLNEFVLTISIAAATSLVLLLFSVQSKVEFTVLLGVILVVLADLVMFGILALSLPILLLPALYSALVALPFLLYIVFDSHLVVTGRPSRSVLKNVYGLP